MGQNICFQKQDNGGSDFEKKYKLSNVVLGEGAYGKVMLGESLKGKQKVAVKLMDKAQMKHSDAGKMHKEVSILKSLNHPNVVRVYEFFDDPDFFKIVMEYVDGGELFERLVQDDNQYTERESREVIYTLATALKHCKDRGVVHRDIKPENILLTQEGKIKLADFNLSKQVDPDLTEFKLLQTMCGTPNYVAPEVLSGRPYDFKCDIWSLGVISFLLLSGGYLPFFVNPDLEGKDELLAKVKEGKWTFAPEKAWASVSEQAKDCISNMLVKKPSRRFNYEQLLAHPWFNKVEAKNEEQIIIKADQLMDLNQKRRMLAASKVKTAVNMLAEIMGPGEADTPETPNGQFFESVKNRKLSLDGGSLEFGGNDI